MISKRFALILGLALLIGSSSSSADEAKPAPAVNPAIAFDDSTIQPGSVRIRLTKNAFNYMRMILRDTFATWAPKGGKGFNVVLDPGYDPIKRTAGLVRTSPGQIAWAIRNSSDGCGNYTEQDLNALDKDYRQFTGTRSPKASCQVDHTITGSWNGNAWKNQRAIEAVVNTAAMDREFGFYTLANDTDCTNFLNFCATGAAENQDVSTMHSMTSVKPPLGTGCTMSSEFVDPALYSCDYQCIAWICGCVTKIDIKMWVWYNAALFIYPTGRIESESSPYEAAMGSALRDPPNISPFTGIARDSSTGRSAGTNITYRASCGSYVQGQWKAGRFPLVGTYDPKTAYDTAIGSYFRPGDDTAMYLNFRQMQVQSPYTAADAQPGTGAVWWNQQQPDWVDVVGNPFKDRVNATCGEDLVYDGTLEANGEPHYFLSTVANCLRPKMWYDFNEKNAATVYGRRPDMTKVWKQCKAFDTYLADGTLNPNRDDNKIVYPGSGLVGPSFGTSLTCGAQACVGGGCPATTTDVFSSLVANPTQGAGWYAFDLASFVAHPWNDADPTKQNSLDVLLKAKDIRLENSLWLDVTIEIDNSEACAIGICFPINGLFITARRIADAGYLVLDNLDVTANIAFSIADSKSCGTAYGNCSTEVWTDMNDQFKNPDKLSPNISIPAGTGIVITGLSYAGISPSPCAINEEDVGNAVENWTGLPVSGLVQALLPACLFDNNGLFAMALPMLGSTLATALDPTLKTAISDIVGSLPNLNAVLGDPMVFGTGLIDLGVYLSDENTSNGSPTGKWPVRIYDGPYANASCNWYNAGGCVFDVRATFGFRPVAFQPPVMVNSKAVYRLDPNYTNPNSFFGVPTMYDPPTSLAPACGANCTRSNPYSQKDTDQVYDIEDILNAASWTDPANNLAYSYAAGGGSKKIMREYWGDPVVKAPNWCITPSQLSSSAGAAQMNGLYPRTNWLSFHATKDAPSAGFAAAARNTYGGWDTMDPFTVLKHKSNTGAKESTPMDYYMSAHIHERFFADLLKAIVATGAACLEFAPQDTQGVDTPWKDLLETEKFVAFLPEAATLFPGKHVSVRLSPTEVPHVRTGMGLLNFTPAERLNDPVGGPLAIVNEPYTVSVALPNMKLDFVVDSGLPTEVSLFTVYWNTALGIFAKQVRSCYKLDPMAGTPTCDSPQINERSISGYLEFFADMNSKSLATAWENGRDGFAPGMFSDPGFGLTKGSAAFFVEKTYCTSNPSKCKYFGISQAIPTLMSSLIQAFIVFRYNIFNFSLDSLYIGPDGPNDDLVGRGDYLGLYINFLGNLDLLEIIEQIGNMAPGQSILPMASIAQSAEKVFFRTNSPTIPITLNQVTSPKTTLATYTYRLDKGFWATPRSDVNLELGNILEGEHTLEVRTLLDTQKGALSSQKPVTYKFTVDSEPPTITFAETRRGTYRKAVKLAFFDYQTPADKLSVEYRIDDSVNWQPLSDDSVSIRDLSDGNHVLRVRATDEAGNTGEVNKQIVINNSFWGCASAASSADMGFVLAALVWLTLYRRRRYFEVSSKRIER